MNTTQRPTPIEFWFDFASGYAYFAALEIEALAERHGRNVLWRPFTLGAAFKVTGAQGIARQHGEAAVTRGVFGSPWIFVDGEPFWGSDRLAMVERWLGGGPW